MVLRKAVEDDGGHTELLALETLDVRVQRKQTVLAVDRPENAFALRHLQDPDAPVVPRGLERQLLVAADDDGARDRRQIAGLPALLVVLHELVDLAADDLALVRLLARCNPALQ